jgi:glycosyltransferase involved in cell wall biosynthesis
MKIAIDVRPLQEKFGGVKEFTLNLLTTLFKLDKKNDYYLFANAFRKSVRFDLISTFNQYSNVHLCLFSWPNKFLNLGMRFLHWPKLDKLIEKNSCQTEKLDFFFLPNLNFIAFSPGFKYILTIHDLSFHHFKEFYSLKQQLWHQILNYPCLIKQATKIITVSRNTKNDLQETFQIPEEKIEIIYPFLNVEIKGRPSCRPQLSQILSSFKRYILFLGTLEPRKNIESLIEAYKILKKEINEMPPLLIAGPKGWKYKSIFKSVNNSIEKDVFFLDYVSQEEKVILYQKATLFVFPSFYEGFGLPPIEAAYFGVPVIASSVSSLPEVLGESAFYINPWNVREIAEAIKLLLANEEYRLKLSQRGKTRALQFTNQESARKLLNIFEEVAKVSGRIDK